MILTMEENGEKFSDLASLKTGTRPPSHQCLKTEITNTRGVKKNVTNDKTKYVTRIPTS